MLRSVVDSLPELATQLGKEPPRVLIEDHGIRLHSPLAGPLRNAFMHLMRNAMDHGLEAPLTRLTHGKPATGTIAVSMELDDLHLRLRLNDDGQGLNLENLRAHAERQGLAQADRPMNDGAVAQLIFAPGFSTAEKVTEVSGRGVGMDAVRGFMQAEGGNVSIELLEPQRGQGRRFQILVTLPAHFAVGEVTSEKAVAA